MLSLRRPVDEHVVVKEGEVFPRVINETSVIGEEINISYTVTLSEPAQNANLKRRHFCPIDCVHLWSAQLEKARDSVSPPLNLTITYPHRSPWGNHLLYLTHVSTKPTVRTRVFKINEVCKEEKKNSYFSFF